MKKLFPFFVLIAIGLSASGQQLSFYRENITMKIREKQFYVSGTYYFRYNLSGIKQLYYPFPVSDQFGNPDPVYLYDLTNNTAIAPTEQDSSGLLFLADFSNHSDISIQISYKQPLLGNRAEYILETTKVWGKPFKEATYQLIIPKGLIITRFSITPDDSISTDMERIYTWEKYNYMPERNMVFEFREEE
ncbi:MAG: hypothetical protein AB9834_16625 [Lentimicrobium sp.]